MKREAVLQCDLSNSEEVLNEARRDFTVRPEQAKRVQEMLNETRSGSTVDRNKRKR